MKKILRRRTALSAFQRILQGVMHDFQSYRWFAFERTRAWNYKITH